MAREVGAMARIGELLSGVASLTPMHARSIREPPHEIGEGTVRDGPSKAEGQRCGGGQ